ncbi:MAG: hypothetical protein GTO14_13955 [Anaerolineales bacterium]|nr:hypothetical protein [Anaerolineales bacterium]
MFPYLVVILAVIFLVLKFSGLLEEFTDAMRRTWGDPSDRLRELQELSPEEEEMEDRLTVFREYLEKPSDQDDDFPDPPSPQ